MYVFMYVCMYACMAMTEDFGDQSEDYLYADASAAIGVANREVLGGSAISTPNHCGCSNGFGSVVWGWAKFWVQKARQIS